MRGRRYPPVVISLQLVVEALQSCLVRQQLIMMMMMRMMILLMMMIFTWFSSCFTSFSETAALVDSASSLL